MSDDRRPLRKDLLGTLALTAVVLVWAVMGPQWLEDPDLKDGPTIGLREICSNADCDAKIDLQKIATECVEMMEEFEADESAIEESCGELQDAALAGWVGTGGLGVATLLLVLGAVFTTFRRDLESGDSAPWLGVSGATVALVSVLAWHLILPESDDDVAIGANLWGLFVGSGVCLTVSLLHSPLFGGRGTGFLVSLIGRLLNQGPPRRRSEGSAVRASMCTDAEVSEFVLREAEHGQQTTSLVLDATLLRLSTTRRTPMGELRVEDRLVLQLPALQGFSHHRLDWLDDFKLVWWGLAIGGVTGTVFGIPALASLLGLGLILSLLQWADPEIIIFETASGRHRKLIWRLNSNLELTAVSMDHLDGAMQGLLRDGNLDSRTVDERAPEIDLRLSARLAAKEEVLERQAQARLEASARREAKRIAREESKAAQKAAKETALANAQADLKAQQEAHAAALAQALAAAQATPAPATAPAPAAAPARPMAAPRPPAAAVPPVMNPPPPTPPPPMGGPIPPPPMPGAPAPMAMPTEAITPAPQIHVAAAPRDDSLSEGEKANLMDALED